MKCHSVPTMCFHAMRAASLVARFRHPAERPLRNSTKPSTPALEPMQPHSTWAGRRASTDARRWGERAMQGAPAPSLGRVTLSHGGAFRHGRARRAAIPGRRRGGDAVGRGAGASASQARPGAGGGGGPAAAAGGCGPGGREGRVGGRGGRPAVQAPAGRRQVPPPPPSHCIAGVSQQGGGHSWRTFPCSLLLTQPLVGSATRFLRPGGPPCVRRRCALVELRRVHPRGLGLPRSFSRPEA